MLRRLFASSCGLTALLALAGCVQATRHSNTMVFGTTTQLGIQAGANAASVPQVNVGYSRQEAVVMPLVANTIDNGETQGPCDPSAPVEIKGQGQFAVHPCLLVGVNGKAQDSYSVLASFGAKFGGAADQTGAKTEGAIAQYFATGVAAQMLAIQGGSSVVAGGEAAKEAAKNKDETAEDITALFGGDAIHTREVQAWRDYSSFQDRIAAKIRLTTADDLPARIAEFEVATGTSAIGIKDYCTSVAACLNALDDKDPYSLNYTQNADTYEAALNAWKTDR